MSQFIQLTQYDGKYKFLMAQDAIESLITNSGGNHWVLTTKSGKTYKLSEEEGDYIFEYISKQQKLVNKNKEKNRLRGSY